MAPKKQTQSPLRRSPRLSGKSSAAEPPHKKQKTTPKLSPKSPKKSPKSPKAKAKKTPEGERTIIVEYCKQCRSFKSRAEQVKEGLEEGVVGLKVVLNPDEPRKGCFEIREEDGEVLLSLQDMKRPFTPMKKLHMEDLITDLLHKLN